MTYTPIARGTEDWDVPLNAALTEQDARITTNAADIDINAADIDTLEGVSNARESDFSLLSWNYDPIASINTSLLTSGTVYMCSLMVRRAGTVSNLYVTTTTTPTLTSGQNFAGIYNSAGTLLAQTADQTTSWGTSGLKIMPVVTPVELAVGEYYLAFLSNGSTPITVARGSANSASGLGPNRPAGSMRFSTGGTGLTGLTALPASITMANRGSGATSIWTAIS